MTQKFYSIKANFQEPAGVRKDIHEGKEHLVVPVVMIVEGVLNSALLLEAEFGKYPQSWDGIPVPVLHPEKNGSHVSANAPDVIERSTIGRIYNTRSEGGKLKAEAWIDTDKATRLGHTALLEELESGQIVEVSTGYFADYREELGEFNGVPYNRVDVNLRPDHLALLPGEIGACSALDGCGTRVNSEKGLVMKTKQAIDIIANALGLRANCECDEEVTAMSKWKEELGKLKANKKLSAEQIEMLMEFDQEQLEMIGALAATLTEVGAGAPAEEEGEGQEMEMDGADEMEGMGYEEKKMANMQWQKPQVNAAQLQAMVDEAIERRDLTRELVANEKCAFDENDLKTFSVDKLKKYAASIREADYSGQGAFATNSDVVDSTAQPLTIHSGVAIRRKQKEA